LRSAERRGDAADIVEAHWALGVTLVNAGEFARAKQHLDNGIERADARPDTRHLHAYGHDPRVVCRCFGAWALWSLGHPDRAVISMREALNLARALSHPESTGFALFFSAWVHQLRREAARTLEETEALIAHASEHGLLQWLTFGRILRGWSLGKCGRGEEGAHAIRENLIAYQAMGSRISRPHFLGLLAETLGGLGRAEEGLSVVIEALAEAERTGERYYESELLRLHGELQLQQDPSGTAGRSVLTRAEDCLQRALDVARQQGARSFELRAALGLCRLHARNGQDGESRRALAGVYGGFTEGFATADLIEARAFLDQKS
jgi:predicted ATPase